MHLTRRIRPSTNSDTLNGLRALQISASVDMESPRTLAEGGLPFADFRARSRSSLIGRTDKSNQILLQRRKLEDRKLVAVRPRLADGSLFQWRTAAFWKVGRLEGIRWPSIAYRGRWFRSGSQQKVDQLSADGWSSLRSLQLRRLACVREAGDRRRLLLHEESA